MEQAQLALATTMHELSKQQDAIANNLANVNSTAFKRRVGTFEPFEVVLDSIARASGATSEATTIPHYREYSDLGQGDFQRTDDSLNVALTGDGFLRVRVNESGRELFTRVGALAVGPDGTLMTRHGHAILGETGNPINVGQATTFKISQRGLIHDTENGNQLGAIGVVRFENPDALHSKGLGLYEANSASGPALVDRFTTLTQGGLERSNVNTISELVTMISLQRHFQTVGRALIAIESADQQLVSMARG